MRAASDITISDANLALSASHQTVSRLLFESDGSGTTDYLGVIYNPQLQTAGQGSKF